MTLITLMILLLNDDHNDGKKVQNQNLNTIMTVTKIYDT